MMTRRPLAAPRLPPPKLLEPILQLLQLVLHPRCLRQHRQLLRPMTMLIPSSHSILAPAKPRYVFYTELFNMRSHSRSAIHCHPHLQDHQCPLELVLCASFCPRGGQWPQPRLHCWICWCHSCWYCGHLHICNLDDPSQAQTSGRCRHRRYAVQPPLLAPQLDNDPR